jgi:hypothetical protein
MDAIVKRETRDLILILSVLKDIDLNNRSSYQAPTQAPASSTQSLEDTMREFMKMIGQSINDVRNSTMVNTQAISKLEMQVGQLASHLGERDKGKLPSQSVNNPKACTIKNSSNQEHAHAIVALRSGR